MVNLDNTANNPQIKNILRVNKISQINFIIFTRIQNLKLRNQFTPTNFINLNPRRTTNHPRKNRNISRTIQHRLKSHPQIFPVHYFSPNIIQTLYLAINIPNKIPIHIHYLSLNNFNHNLINLLTQMVNIPLNIINQSILIQIKRTKINPNMFALDDMINRNLTL